MAPSWMRTLAMSIGWIMHVATMPLAPPLTNGLIDFHTLESDMVARFLLRCVCVRWVGALDRHTAAWCACGTPVAARERARRGALAR